MKTLSSARIGRFASMNTITSPSLIPSIFSHLLLLPHRHYLTFPLLVGVPNSSFCIYVSLFSPRSICICHHHHFLYYHHIRIRFFDKHKILARHHYTPTTTLIHISIILPLTIVSSHSWEYEAFMCDITQCICMYISFFFSFFPYDPLSPHLSFQTNLSIYV